MDDLRNFYKTIVFRLLTKFQLLEFALKMYIGRAYSVIKNLTDHRIHFGYSATDIEEFPLERLLNIFAKLNANAELIARLNKLRTERNHLAHKAFVLATESMYDRGTVEDKCVEYDSLEYDLSECLEKVLEETRLLSQKH